MCIVEMGLSVHRVNCCICRGRSIQNVDAIVECGNSVVFVGLLYSIALEFTVA